MRASATLWGWTCGRGAEVRCCFVMETLSREACRCIPVHMHTHAQIRHRQTDRKTHKHTLVSLSHTRTQKHTHARARAHTHTHWVTEFLSHCNGFCEQVSGSSCARLFGLGETSPALGLWCYWATTILHFLSSKLFSSSRVGHGLGV